MSTPCLLVVEDEAVLARAVERALRGDFGEIVHAQSIAEAEVAFARRAGAVDVVLADVGLPDGDGLDLVAKLRAVDPTVGAVVATGRETTEVATRAVSLGVQGYLRKPFGTNELRVNIHNARRWRILERENRDHRERLERLVQARTAELADSRWETISRLSLAAERRDDETANHLERMSSYSAVLARRAGLSPERCEEIRMAAPMHDIGKIGIPDSVLLHDGCFDARQRQVMAEHTIIGHQILAGSSSTLLQTAARIARSHHEWWNGMGYPDRLAGGEIPLEGRIVAIADVFDALMSARRYKPAFTIERTVELLREERGTHFDPDLVDLFLDDLDELVFIREAFRDELATPG